MVYSAPDKSAAVVPSLLILLITIPNGSFNGTSVVSHMTGASDVVPAVTFTV